MAEARSEEEEESMRDTREQVVRRQPNGSRGRPDRRKPDHRLSQGPLSSIRSVIKRTSTRSTSVCESSRDRDPDRDRDRRRPEITILSAEPLAATSWFSRDSGGFLPPPSPAPQIWGRSIPPSVQPPSYEEVIREKTQQQVLPPSCCVSPSQPASTTTIATQTDLPSYPDPPDTQAGRPGRPPRPRLSSPPRQSCVTSGQSALASLVNGGGVSQPPEVAAPCCDLTVDRSPLTSGAPGDKDLPLAAVYVAPPPESSHHYLERPRPRPRSRLVVQPISTEVKVQTLVRLCEDGRDTLAATSESSNQEVSPGKYLQELLQAFSSEDWGSPERCSSSSSSQSQSESEAGPEGVDEEDMATLKARIQVFEQQEAEGSCGDIKDLPSKGPEPRPRPRLQGQPAKSVLPPLAPKPKNLSHTPKPSTKLFWEDVSMTTDPPAPADPGSAPKCVPLQGPQPTEDTVPDTLQSNTPASLPVPTPRPSPPKINSLANPKLAPRPTAAPRTSVGALNPEKTAAAVQPIPTQPPRSSMELGSGAPSETGGRMQAGIQTVKPLRPDVPAKPVAWTSPCRSNALNVHQKSSAASLSSPDQNPVPPQPTVAAMATVPKPSGPTPGLKPPVPGLSPALRKSPVIQTKPESSCTLNPDSSSPALHPRPSSVKLLPLRPPPIKSIPERPPPPTINSTCSTNQMAPPYKTGPTPSVSPTSQSTSSLSANQTQPERASKRGPPLPPRPKPGHPLYSSYMKQEVLIVLDNPGPPENQSDEGRSQTTVGPLISQSQCLLDIQPEPAPPDDGPLKSALEDLSQSEPRVTEPVQVSSTVQKPTPPLPLQQKGQPDPLLIRGPRCVALFDYEGEQEDELTFSQGDVIALLELSGPQWGRGQIHGRTGLFPLSFTEVVEAPGNVSTGSTEPQVSRDQDPESEWAVALFDFPGQTEEDLPFHKGALIQVTEHVDADWRRGRLGEKEGLYPVAFTQRCHAQPIICQESMMKGVAKFDFTAETEDELTLKVGDVITQVEVLNEQWILGVVGGKRGIVPKCYVSLL